MSQQLAGQHPVPLCWSQPWCSMSLGRQGTEEMAVKCQGEAAAHLMDSLDSNARIACKTVSTCLLIQPRT